MIPGNRTQTAISTDAQRRGGHWSATLRRAETTTAHGASSARVVIPPWTVVLAVPHGHHDCRRTRCSAGIVDARAATTPSTTSTFRFTTRTHSTVRQQAFTSGRPWRAQ